MTATVFVSYCEKDRDSFEEVRKFLAPRGAENQALTLWDRTQIPIGDVTSVAVAAAINSSRYCIILVSQDYFDDQEIAGKELPKLLDMLAEGMRVFWVPLRRATIASERLAKLEAVWDPNRPLSTLDRPAREEALFQIADAIKKATQTSLDDGGGITVREGEAETPFLSMDFLHCLIDRESQEFRFIDTAQQRLLNQGGNILLVPFSVADCPDLLIQRIKEYTFPVYLKKTVKTCNVPFPQPAASVGEALKSYVLKVLAEGNTNIAIADIGSGRPTEESAMQSFRKQIEIRNYVFWTIVRPDEPDEFQKSLLLGCIKWWMNFEVTMAVYPIVVLFFQRRAARPGKPGDEAKELAANCGWLTGCLDRFAKGKGPKILKSLQSITSVDVDDWLLNNRIAENFDMGAVRKLAESLFNDSPFQPMKMIRDAYDSDWKNKIVRRKA